jgi:hypothetical protein
MKYLFSALLTISILFSFGQEDYEARMKKNPKKNLTKYKAVLGTDSKGNIFNYSMKKGQSLQVIDPKTLTVQKEIFLEVELKDKGYSIYDLDLKGDFIFTYAYKKSENALYLFALDHNLNFIGGNPIIGYFNDCINVNQRTKTNARYSHNLLNFVHSFYDEKNKEYIFIVNNTCKKVERLNLDFTVFDEKIKKKMNFQLRPAVYGDFKSLHYYKLGSERFLSMQLTEKKALTSHLFAFDEEGQIDEIKINLPKPYFAMEHLVTRNQNNETIVYGLAINGSSSKIDGVFQGKIRQGDDELMDITIFNMFDYFKEKGMSLGDIEYRGLTTKSLNLNYQLIDHLLNKDGSMTLIFQNRYDYVHESVRNKCFKNFLIINIGEDNLNWIHFLPGGGCVYDDYLTSNIHIIYEDEIYIHQSITNKHEKMTLGEYNGEKIMQVEWSNFVSKITPNGELIFRKINEDKTDGDLGIAEAVFLLNEKTLLMINMDASALWGVSKKLKFYIVDL